MHFHKMPCCPRDALCSLNNKMHRIGGDGLAFQAARKRRPSPSTRSRQDKRESGVGALAWRVELGGELHLLSATESLYDDKLIQMELSFSPDLGKLLLMIARCNDLQNRGAESAEWHTHPHSLCSGTHTHTHTRRLALFLPLQNLARRLLSENNEASTSHHHSNNYGSISSLSLLGCTCRWINNMILLCQSVSHLNASQRGRYTEPKISLIPVLCSAMACINEHFVVLLLSAAIEEDACDSPYSSHHSLMAGRINGKAADSGTRQPSWVKDDSALFCPL